MKTFASLMWTYNKANRKNVFGTDPLSGKVSLSKMFVSLLKCVIL